MFLGLLTLLTALTISAVAIYYSVAGLVAIFAAAALPIMIMGGTLEVAKLVTAVWLHRYWKQATWWLKTYLTTAVVVLMFITSMGIFGFLSKAHIEQTSATEESIAQAETLQNEIDRQLGIIGRAENRIRQLENSETGADANIQSQIDKEQERIDSAYSRIQPAIDEQNKIISQVTQLFQNELDKIDSDLKLLQDYINNGEIAKAQAMVGARADGQFGSRTAAAFTAYQERKAQERNEWLQKIQEASESSTVRAARAEIQRLRRQAETQIAESNRLINRLREQLGDTQNAEDVQKAIDEQQERVRTASLEVDRLTEEKIKIESEYRKLEAEVGPIKYIAEFIYGDSADTNMLEEAVRWVIIIIIFVFDPLAVLLLIASQYTFEYRRSNKDDRGGWLRQWREYEQARAQRIVDNPGFDYTVPSPSEEEVNRKEQEDDKPVEKTDADADATVRDMVPEDNVSTDDGTEPSVEQAEVQPDGLTADEVARGYSELVESPFEKKDIESSEELKQARTEELEAQDNDITWTEAKRSWKEDHPDLTLKEFKEKYVNGEIDYLPWEDYVADESKKKNYIIKEGTVQIRKTTEE